MSKYRECLVREHQNQAITHLCVYKECLNEFRWGCYACLLQKFHFHSQETKNYFLSIEQIIQLLSQKQTPFEELISQIKKDVFLITRIQINRIINIYQQNVNIQLIPHSEQLAMNQQWKKNDELMQCNLNQNNLDLKYALYFQPEAKRMDQLEGACISPNEKLLFYFIKQNCFMFDLISQQQICRKSLNYEPYGGRFSYDSKYCFIICSEGILFFRVNQNFKFINRLCKNTFHKIIFISPCACLMSNRKDIIVKQIKLNKLSSKIKLRSRYLIESDYYEQSRMLAIVFKTKDRDCKIRLIKIPTYQKIIEQKFVDCSVIKIINNSTMISTEEQSFMDCCYQLYLWQINYATQKLTIIKTFKSNSLIRKFDYFRSIEKIFIHHRKYIQILNLDFEEFQSINLRLLNKCNYFSLFIYQITKIFLLLANQQIILFSVVIVRNYIYYRMFLGIQVTLTIMR